MHFQQHEETRAKYVTSEPKIGQTIVWPFMIQVGGVAFCFHFFTLLYIIHSEILSEISFRFVGTINQIIKILMFGLFFLLFNAKIECNGQSVLHIDSARNNIIIALDDGGRFWYRLCNTRLSLFTGHWFFERTSRWYRMHSMVAESAS